MTPIRNGIVRKLNTKNKHEYPSGRSLGLIIQNDVLQDITLMDLLFSVNTLL